MRLGITENKKPEISIWLHRIAVAAAITIAIQLVFLYVAYGEFSSFFHIAHGMEFTFTFLYFLSLFWIYPKISHTIHSTALSGFRSIIIKIIEGVTVVISTFFLTAIIKILPIWILMQYINANYENRNMRFDLDNLRQSLIIHAVLGLLFYYFVERERIRKQIQAEQLRYAQLQKEEFKGQLEHLKNQVNPHFLFKSLETLDSLIEKDPEKAVEFVTRLSFVYRSFLDRKEPLIPLAKEMELVEAYIYMLKVRYGDQIRFENKIMPECRSLQLPPGSIQILIENAVLYNEITPERPLHIKIHTERDKLVVRNDLQQIQQEKPTGVGLKNIIERYKYLTDEAVQLDVTGKEFVVKLPILKVEEYEHHTE